MRRRHRRLNSTPELDITAFMNLMIVLVPVLLLGMVFTQIRMIELDFPGLAKGEVPDPDHFRLEVVLVPGGMRVADSERGIIRSLPLREGKQDFAGLRTTLQAIKQRMPEKTDIVLRLGGAVDYQTLVTAMDTVRSYPAVVAASVVEAELFPDVSLGDAPDDLRISAVTDHPLTGGRP
ncbi:biopolymer transporter ExbD [Marinobacter halodurans]|uniref:Biopolymer transporter ExbD n=1 Tax=Marinobacter halodurans TaxID=2528979 RepID=A0ABY1ZFY9_9GAMM|nr:biopolymer transporter ExbD [Marinobacter halodurans]TBW50153.1 biopolymer transporter ExbD [Marinobacter halodurans]